MNIVMIGTGYVGLVSGACFAAKNHNVICIDKDAAKIEGLKKGVMPIYEQDLAELVADAVVKGNLHFSTKLENHINEADIVFIAVGTPTNEADGSVDTRYLDAAAKEIAGLAIRDLAVCVKSTVEVGTSKRLAELMHMENPNVKFELISNPEFLREGNAVADFMNPDRIVVGLASDHAQTLMAELYEPWNEEGFRILYCSNNSAEIIKYASNGFLATKIAFINQIADLCEKVGGDVELVAQGMGLDPRIGKDFLKAGPGFGGSCFPKDTKALAVMGRRFGAIQTIVEDVIAANHKRPHDMTKKIVSALDSLVKGKTIAILGLTFKAGTDDMRDSPALPIITDLLAKGAILRLYDPIGMEKAKEEIGDLVSLYWADSCQDALQSSDAAVIVTEWLEFKALEVSHFTKANVPLVIDLRNILNSRDFSDGATKLISVGK